ncbi:MAG: serine protease [Paludibacter sp.]|nr:serine protease [Paludibacter sp.]
METLLNLEPLLRVYWFIAIIASLIFIVQTILTFTGSDATDGIEADFDGDFDGSDAPFQLFSFRNLINFLLGFSWSGISLYKSIEGKALLIFVSVVIGALFVYIFFLVISQLLKLSEDNSFSISKTINKSADVYLTIPAQRSGKGKVLVSVHGSLHELDAITDGEKIPSGAMCKVVAIENDQLLIVEKL